MTRRHITRSYSRKVYTDTERHAYANTTPFPNILLDEVMPGLKDTEWRLLCVIVRQTWGWQAGPNGQRKQSDWLTQKQLMARTGRNSEAISRAIDVLVRRGLIEVCDEEGVLLVTSQQRRRSGGRLYFSWKRKQASGGVDHAETSAAKGRWEVAGEIGLTGVDTDLRVGKSELLGHRSEVAGGKSQAVGHKREVGKANTTKETQTKYLYQETILAPQHRGKLDAPATEGHVACVNAVHPDAGNFLQECRNLHQTYLGSSVPLSAVGASDLAHVSELLHIYGYDHLRQLLIRFFKIKGAQSSSSSYGLDGFRSNIRRLLIEEIKERLDCSHGSSPVESAS